VVIISANAGEKMYAVKELISSEKYLRIIIFINGNPSKVTILSMIQFFPNLFIINTIPVTITVKIMYINIFSDFKNMALQGI